VRWGAERFCKARRGVKGEGIAGIGRYAGDHLQPPESVDGQTGGGESVDGKRGWGAATHPSWPPIGPQ